MLKDETLSEKLITKWFWIYFFVVLIAPTWYIVKVLVSNDLDVWDVWIIYSVISFVYMLSIYNDFWFTESLMYFLPKYWIWKKYDYFKTAVYLSLFIQIVTWLLIAIIIFFGADYLALHYFHSPEAWDILKVFCLYFLWINLYQVWHSLYMSFQDMFLDKFVEFVWRFSVMLFTIFFFFSDYGNVFVYAISWVLGLIIAIFVSILLFYKKYDYTLKKWKLTYDKTMLSTYMRYALWALLWTNSIILLLQIDQQMIIYYLWPIQAWYYANYLSLLQIYMIILIPILELLFPITTELISKWAKDKMLLMQNFFYKYFSVLSLSFGWLLFVLWPIIAIVLFWTKFLYSWQLLFFSWLFIIFHTLYLINFFILSWLWKVREKVKILLITILFNIISNMILINRIGTVWAIITTVICWIFMFVASLMIVNKQYAVSFNFRFFIKNVLFISVFIALIYYLKGDIFVIDNAYRYSNLLYLILIWICYYIYLWLVNYKEMIILKDEIVDMRNKQNMK